MDTQHAAPFPQLRTAYLRAIAEVWRKPTYLATLAAEASKPRGVLPLLEADKDWPFKFPFDVKFVISGGQTRPQWAPVGTSGWFGFGDEFVIYLPEKPDAQEADVLARYCTEFPSLLGTATVPNVEPPPDFAEFGVVTSRILALAWADTGFRSQLYAATDARTLVQGAMDYLVPWNFTLQFKEYKSPGGRTSAHLLSTAYWKQEFPYSQITVFCPQSPPVGVEAIALAAYNDTGGQYPFTCA
jgi:ribosomally synthesized peptide (two-chain TOMM family)